MSGVVSNVICTGWVYSLSPAAAVTRLLPSAKYRLYWLDSKLLLRSQRQIRMILVTCTLQDSSCIYVTAGWHCSGRGKHHGRSFWDNGGECQPKHFTREENGEIWAKCEICEFTILQNERQCNSGQGTPESHCGLSVTIITVTSAGISWGQLCPQ